VYLGADGFPPYEGDDDAYLSANPSVVNKEYWKFRRDHVSMKWNDAWTSNKDCDNDGLLDRHHRHASYVGSGAWLTNHQSGSYNQAGDRVQHWTYFLKIVALPTGAVCSTTVCTLDGKEFGVPIWGQFAVVQEIWTLDRTVPTVPSTKAR
jgi:hypothetical protein